MQKTTKQEIDEEFAALSKAANEAVNTHQTLYRRPEVDKLFEQIGKLKRLVADLET